MSVYQDDDDGKQAQQKEIHFKLCIYKTMDKTSRAEKETEKKTVFRFEFLILSLTQLNEKRFMCKQNHQRHGITAYQFQCIFQFGTEHFFFLHLILSPFDSQV